MTLSRWTRWRIGAIGALFAAVAVWVVLEAADLQIRQSERLRHFADKNYLKEIEIPPSRGRILDRNGKELAATLQVPSVYANPRVLAHVPGAAAKLARALGIEPARMREKLASRRYFVWLKRQITPEEERAVRALGLASVAFRHEPRRFYPLRTVASTVIGFAGTDGRGLEGVERAYDEHLRGRSATWQGIRDALGRELLIDGSVDTSASAGADVVLTLDAYISSVAERVLLETIRAEGARAGTVIVMDPRNGEILAMANAPTFNPNRPAEMAALDARNRAITDTFEPGSTMKTFTFAAAFEAQRLQPTDGFDCEMGRMKVGRYTIRDTHPLGVATAAEVYQQSSNICTVKIARRIGKDALHDSLIDFGFGRRTGLGLRGEQQGIVRPTKKWGEIGFANVAFGQGLTATPLQITAGFAVVAAGGVRRTPRLGLHVVDPEGRRQPMEADAGSGPVRVVSERAAKTLMEIMAGVPTPEGTARLAAVPGYRVAGKTGTAQKVTNGAYDPDKWLASFIGIAPVDNPRIVIGVFIDEPHPVHLGGKVAAPAFRQIAEPVLKYLGVPPTDPQAVAVAEAKAAAQHRSEAKATAEAAPDDEVPRDEGPGSDAYVLMSDEEFFPLDSEKPEAEQIGLVAVPDFAGMSLGRALLEAESAGLELAPEGSGVAVDQSVAPLRQVPEGTKLRVSFRPRS
jgi:cell division protein FtsI (penicillin-binding protein 3)